MSKQFVFLVDSSVVLAAVGPAEDEESRERRLARANSLSALKMIWDDRNRIMLATLALAEVMSNGVPEPAAGFKFAPLDVATARVLAQIRKTVAREAVILDAVNGRGADYWKSDAIILATAKFHQVDGVLTNDIQQAQLATDLGLPAWDAEEFLTRPWHRQRPLLALFQPVADLQ